MPPNPGKTHLFGESVKSLLSSDLFKLSALGAAVLYGALFLGYHAYYSRLGIRPEDLGVSNTYILIRSIGFIVQIGVVFGTLVVAYFFLDFLRKKKWHILYVLIAGVFAAAISYYLYSLAPWGFWWAGFGIVAGASLAFIYIIIQGWKDLKPLVAFIVISLLATIIVPAAAVVVRANNLASLVLEYQSIRPYEIVGVPMLDVLAECVKVTWIGPPNARPAIFGTTSPVSAQGLMVGTESGIVFMFIRNGNAEDRVQIPSSQVLIENAGMQCKASYRG
jgi:hypothetical protein